MSATELLVVGLVSIAGAFVKSVTGMGYPLIAIPTLALAFGVETAVAVIAIPNAALNALLAFDVRKEWRRTRDLPALVATGLVGGVVGALVLVEAPERPLLIGLAISVLAFVIQRLRAPAYALAPATTRRWAPWVGLAAGFSHGAVGVSGPIVALWFQGYRLPKDAYVLAVTLVFLVGGLAQLGVLVAAGVFGPSLFGATGVAMAATLAMIPIGRRVRDRLAGQTFDRLILALLLLSGLSLVGRALFVDGGARSSDPRFESPAQRSGDGLGGRGGERGGLEAIGDLAVSAARMQIREHREPRAGSRDARSNRLGFEDRQALLGPAPLGHRHRAIQAMKRGRREALELRVELDDSFPTRRRDGCGEAMLCGDRGLRVEAGEAVASRRPF